MDYFYAIFKDVENSLTKDYNDIFPNIPFPDKPHGTRQAKREYKRRLVEVSATIHE
jgi:hypothetical protein